MSRGIDFTAFNRPSQTLFGQASGNGNASANGDARQNERPKAKTWLNIGYVKAIEQADGTVVEQFISGIGIPLDTAEPKKLTGTNKGFRQLISAQNALLGKFQGLAEQLEPGTDFIIDGPNGLALQFRKVLGDEPLPSDNDEPNPFAMNFDFVLPKAE